MVYYGGLNCPLCRTVQSVEYYENNQNNQNNENNENNENIENNQNNIINNQNNLYIENTPTWMDDVTDYNYILQELNNTIHTNNVDNIFVVN